MDASGRPEWLRFNCPVDESSPAIAAGSISAAGDRQGVLDLRVGGEGAHLRRGHLAKGGAEEFLKVADLVVGLAVLAMRARCGDVGLDVGRIGGG